MANLASRLSHRDRRAPRIYRFATEIQNFISRPLSVSCSDVRLKEFQSLLWRRNSVMCSDTSFMDIESGELSRGSLQDIEGPHGKRSECTQKKAITAGTVNALSQTSQRLRYQ